MKIYSRHDATPLMANGGRSIVGPNGKKTCRWCGVEVAPPRRSWCSDACVHEFNLRTNAGYARWEVQKRDGGVCALCGLDCSELGTRLMDLPFQCRRTYRVILNLPSGRWAFWDVDHIVPVSEGGGACGLENLRTLCWRCHKGETKKLAARRARRKRTHPTAARTRLKQLSRSGSRQLRRAPEPGRDPGSEP